MPEYLAPGVYVEETSFRANVIEGVSTSTAGFVGPTRFGPTSGQPALLTGYADFVSVFGDEQDLVFAGVPRTNFVAHAARAFFAEGGARLYVSRVFGGDLTTGAGYATKSVANDSVSATLRARYPGRAGEVRVRFSLRVGRDAVVRKAGEPSQVNRIKPLDLVYVGPVSPADASSCLFVVTRDPATNALAFTGLDGSTHDSTLLASPGVQVRLLTAVVAVSRRRIDASGAESWGEDEVLGEYSFHPDAADALQRTFAISPQSPRDALTTPFSLGGPDSSHPTLPKAAGAGLALALFGTSALETASNDATSAADRMAEIILANGSDGTLPLSSAYEGDVGFSDQQNDPQGKGLNGLLAFEAVPDISIVAAPDSDRGNDDGTFAVQGTVVAHCEKMRYRVAVLDVPLGSLVSTAQDFRNRRSSERAALYYPWVVVPDPRTGARLKLPPSGFVAGIYARNDIERQVFKAPANEVIRSALDLEVRLTKAHQEALNPEGVNCLRFLPGAGNLVYGARTISADPEWKYVSVRRYFNYLERSIENGTGWIVFENNGTQLWGNVRRTIEDFLLSEWKSGGLLGNSAKEAYFVRCDRSTMTQNDIDNGRLVCLIGVAPVKPAEFVIFRIGQWTASATS